jgi:hypothetical protein
VPEIGIGNKPIDDGNYLFTPEEKVTFLNSEPAARTFFRRWLGSEEFINGIERWCLLLKDCPPDLLRRMPEVLKRVEAVKKFRLASKSIPTQKLAASPTRFHVENFPKHDYLVIPKVSSERRLYIPIAFATPNVLIGDAALIIPEAKLFHFGVLTSAMHMAWVRQVCGRLESRYRYSNKLVYNNFPWPKLESCISPDDDFTWPLNVCETDIGFLTRRHDDPGYLSESPKKAKKVNKAFSADDKKRLTVEVKAQAVLDARAKYPLSTLADLYDPLTMPHDLVKAHTELDRAVDQCYRSAPFSSDRQRVEYLFALYEQYTAPLLPARKKKKSAPGL